MNTIFPEATWTSPRDDCPHPERWHSTDSDSTEVEVSHLVAAFVGALQPELVVETGTAWGQTAELIGKTLRRSGHGQLVSLETDPARCAASRIRCEGLPVDIIEAPSLSYTPPGPIGFAWLDSLTDLRVSEANYFHDWMAPGSFIGIHDTGPQHQPLRERIEDLCVEGWLRPVFLPTPRGVVFCEVLR